MNITKELDEMYTIPHKTRFKCRVCGIVYETLDINDVSMINIEKLINECCVPDNLVKVR